MSLHNIRIKKFEEGYHEPDNLDPPEEYFEYLQDTKTDCETFEEWLLKNGRPCLLHLSAQHQGYDEDEFEPDVPF